jgi:putative FmdB family regulatory protein
MPIYEYQCEKCGHEFEREQKITDEPVKVCPKCRARKVKRLISLTSFTLKGGGWYSDLYSSSKGKSGDDAKGEGKSESKSEGVSSDAATKAPAPEPSPGGGKKDKPKAKAKKNAA